MRAKRLVTTWSTVLASNTTWPQLANRLKISTVENSYYVLSMRKIIWTRPNDSVWSNNLCCDVASHLWRNAIYKLTLLASESQHSVSEPKYGVRKRKLSRQTISIFSVYKIQCRMREVYCKTAYFLVFEFFPLVA